jgi:hypothetical protein
MQATRCSALDAAAGGSRRGSTATHASIAIGHRGWKRHPTGMRTASGVSPRRIWGFRRHLGHDLDALAQRPHSALVQTGEAHQARMDERVRRVERRLEPIVLIAALLVIPVIIVEQSSLGEPWRTIAGRLRR